jgi:hypothetical protein
MAARIGIRFRCRWGVYDRTIDVLKTAVRKAKLDQSEALSAIKRLDRQARLLGRHASGPSVEALFADERARLHQCGGQSVFGLEPPQGQTGSPRVETASGHRRSA